MSDKADDSATLPDPIRGEDGANQVDNVSVDNPSDATEDITGSNDLTRADYDINPPKLYKYIEKKNWAGIIEQCKDQPHEASILEYRKDYDESIRWSQLALHAAIMFKANHEVIKELLNAFSAGAQVQDDLGMLPYHLAFQNGSSDSILDLLVEAYPKGLHVKDNKGRIPMYCAKPLTKSEKHNVYEKVFLSSHFTAYVEQMKLEIENDNKSQPQELKDSHSTVQTISSDAVGAKSTNAVEEACVEQKVKQEIENEYKLQLQEMKDSHSAEIEALKTIHKREFYDASAAKSTNVVNSDEDGEVDALKNQYKAMLDSGVEEAAKIQREIHEIVMKNAKDHYDKSMKDLKVKHKKELAESLKKERETHSKFVKEIKETHAVELRKLVEDASSKEAVARDIKSAYEQLLKDSKNATEAAEKEKLEIIKSYEESLKEMERTQNKAEMRMINLETEVASKAALCEHSALALETQGTELSQCRDLIQKQNADQEKKEEELRELIQKYDAVLKIKEEEAGGARQKINAVTKNLMEKEATISCLTDQLEKVNKEANNHLRQQVSQLEKEFEEQETALKVKIKIVSDELCDLEEKTNTTISALKKKVSEEKVKHSQTKVNLEKQVNELTKIVDEERAGRQEVTAKLNQQLARPAWSTIKELEMRLDSARQDHERVVKKYREGLRTLRSDKKKAEGTFGTYKTVMKQQNDKILSLKCLINDKDNIIRKLRLQSAELSPQGSSGGGGVGDLSSRLSVAELATKATKLSASLKQRTTGVEHEMVRKREDVSNIMRLKCTTLDDTTALVEEKIGKYGTKKEVSAM